MGNQGASFVHLYHQALVNPKEITLADFEELLARYPYSQPLSFAFERRKFLQDEQPAHIGARAILQANNASWLAEYVRLPVEEVPVVEVEDDDYVPFEDIAASSEEMETIPPKEEKAAENEMDPSDGRQEGRISAAIDEQEDNDTLETLVQEGIGGGDYFSVHAKDIQFEQLEELPSEEEQQHAEQRKDEDISLYNDELMPYSFRWWLHKTRLEHADTYQPFASPQLPVTNKASFDPEELDRVVLDQQIREHIIHLQNPEDKLSEEVKQRKTSSDDGSTKVTEVIERFIREEPQIQPPQPENLNVENKARKSSEEQFDLVTETLANIYTDQAMYVKAIEVYKKLILRFPEKKSYFATRIKELEEKLY